MLDIEKATFDAFLDAIKRFRWFVLTCVLLSTIILTHVYLESGFTMTQLQGFALEQHISDKKLDLETRTKSLQEKFKGQLSPDSLGKKPEAVSLAGEWLVFDRHANMLKNHTVGDRSVPVLGYAVPGNDFFPVMSGLLLVLSVAVWLNARSILASLERVNPTKSRELNQLVRLHFLFTVPVEGRQGAAHFIQYAAIWIPLGALCVAATADLFPAFSRKLSNPNLLSLPMEPLLFRLVLVFIIVCGTLAAAMATTGVIGSINKQTNS